MDIKNVIILVTGATSGIGKSLTGKLLNSGASVAFCGRSQEKMTEFVSCIKHINKEKYYYETFDVSDENSIICFVNNAVRSLGKFDILVNCAGVNSARSAVSEMKTSDLEYMLRINLISPFVFLREVYNSSIEHNTGLFINVLSTVCLFSNEGIGAYTASKAGFDALVKVFRKEVRSRKVRVCSVYPGGVNSSFRKEARPEYLSPDTVADAIISVMLSDENTALDELVIRPVIETNFC